MDEIVITELSYIYETNGASVPEPVFNDLSLRIKSEQVTCLVGPSGCGKTTLLNLIAGFLRPSRGVIEQNGKSSDHRIGYIFQRDALLPWRTVRANLGLASELRGIPTATDEPRIADYLSAFNLMPSVLTRYPDELSGGMRQRISIIQSLMADPSLLLLDEPFASLDFYTKLRLENDFRNLVASRGMAAVFVTHDIEEAIAVGDRVVVMGRSPRGIVADLSIDFDGGNRLAPEMVRGHRQAAEYFSRIWTELRDAV